ncbi:MAG: biopolymer transporter ExbD [Gemmatimonadales bacterium]|nr:biopolymer transporter ExbD [Gemmatimonadales bacterium]
MQQPLINKSASISGINVTPIIDVALVLVIILLITTPVMTISDLDIDLPEAHTRGAEGSNRLNITLAESGGLSLDRELILPEDLPATLKARLSAEDSEDLLVIVRADGNITHDAVQGILDTARQAGASRLAIATTMSRKEATWKR